jgi:protein-ribulosamine 3-kinase
MSMDSDISWQLLRGIVHDWAGTSAELAEATPLVGGAIHTTLRLKTKDGRRCVLKITPHRVDRGYQDEAYQLNLFRSLGLPAPEVYTCRMGTLDQPHSYILMEHIDGINLAEAKRQISSDEAERLQMHLAELTLVMHDQKSTHYWRVTAGERTEHDGWAQFYREMYDPIWHECEKTAHLPVKCRKQISKIHERLDQLIGHDDSPRLVHWDLWSGNILCKPDDQGRWWISAILDPNCKFAHAEAELAYLELFHTVNGPFMRTYQQQRKLPADYHRVRKLVYQLYPLIDDVTLHGTKYVPLVVDAVDKVAKVL